ncbi:MAG: peptidoglycan DD-metalloendopeptidase family protein [Lachnospiraceae bacterium]|nr:peptidoglycan DD-metalloendopeptidase family protein [Lachnospiraceae bacterium]
MSSIKRTICVILTVILAFVFVGQSSSARCDELTNDSIRKKEAEISEAKKERDSLKGNLTDVKKVKQELEKSKNDLDAYVTELDSNVTQIQLKIDDLEIKIADKEEEIVQKEAELDEAIRVQTEQYEAMKKRIKFMYEQGDLMYMDLLFNANTFGDMLNKAEYIEELSAYDRRKLDEYVAYTKYVTLCKEELEEEKGILDDTKAAQEQEKAALDELIDTKKGEIDRLSSDITNKEAAIAEYEAEIAAQNETIQALEAAVAEERRRLAEEQNRRYDGGMFTFPCPNMKRVSDEYGYRIHPTLGIEKFHNGVDMAAPSGSPILAAYNGKVVAADYSSTMGNYIMINHGDGLYTIYMHASALYVSKGQEVSKGQTIAAVGSTGRSTGPHLHFGVRRDGNYVNPWQYLSR